MSKKWCKFLWSLLFIFVEKFEMACGGFSKVSFFHVTCEAQRKWWWWQISPIFPRFPWFPLLTTEGSNSRRHHQGGSESEHKTYEEQKHPFLCFSLGSLSWSINTAKWSIFHVSFLWKLRNVKSSLRNFFLPKLWPRKTNCREVSLSRKYKKFEKLCSTRLISFFGQNETKNH